MWTRLRSTCSQAFSHHHHQELKVVCCTSLWAPSSSSSSSSAGSQQLFLRVAAVGVSLRGSRRRHTAVQHLFWKSCSTTVESASVETSPSSRSSQAILRSSRLMIFPADGEKAELGFSRATTGATASAAGKNDTPERRGGTLTRL